MGIKLLTALALVSLVGADDCDSYTDAWLLTDNEKVVPMLKDDYRISEDPSGFEPLEALYGDEDEQAHETEY